MKRTKTTLKVAGGLFLIGFILAILDFVEVAGYFMVGMMVVLVFMFPFVLIADITKRAGEKHKAREAMKATPEYQQRQENLRRLEEERTTIVEVKLIGGGSVKEHKYGAKGAVVGGLIAGVPGAIVGAALPNGKQTQKQKFAVKYQDGHVKIEEHNPGTKRYNELIAYLKWEDIE